MEINNQLGGVLNRHQVSNESIDLARTNSKHLTAEGLSAPLNQGEKSFGEMMIFDSLKNVSDAEQEASNLSSLAAIDPSAVNSEDLTIAMAKAELGIGLTKAIIDRGIKAYQEILSFR